MLPNESLTHEDVAREVGKVVERPAAPTADCPPGFVRVRDPKTGTVWAVLKERP